MDDNRDDERVSLNGLDPTEALKALLAVDPAAPPATKDDDKKPGESEPDRPARSS